MSPEPETRFEEPQSLQKAYELQAILKQKTQEIQAGLTAINEERPPRIQTNNYQNWVDARGRRISAHRKTVQHLNFVREWIQRKEREKYMHGALPSKVLTNVHFLVQKYERLFALVGEFLDDDSDENWDAMAGMYAEIQKELDQ